MNPPNHYKSTMLMDYLVSHNIGFAEGNICKYVARWQNKDGIKDLLKARDYLNALIAHAELQQPDVWSSVSASEGLLSKGEKL